MASAPRAMRADVIVLNEEGLIIDLPKSGLGGFIRILGRACDSRAVAQLSDQPPQALEVGSVAYRAAMPCAADELRAGEGAEVRRGRVRR